MKSTKLAALVMALSLFACRSGGDDDGDDGDTGDDGTAADDTIFDIQSDAMPPGTAVTLRDVVVVAVDAYGGRSGGVYVMEPEGGAFSGVFVFVGGGATDELSPGDIVDVEGGVKEEFALDEDETGRKLTEISPPDGGAVSITKTGEGDVPEPETVVPWELSADDAESEKWEGVLVRFENVRVHSPPDGVSSTDETLQEMLVTGPYAVQSALTGLADIEAGDCYSSIVGIGDYFFNYKILPRSQDDLVAGADDDCLPPESGDELCGDDTDNDYNGFADCQDFSCADAAAACPTTETTVADIQAGEVEADTTVALTGVTITAVQRVESGTQNFWVQDAAASAENNGVVVFWPTAAGELPAEVVVGATVDIQATVTEFPCLTPTGGDEGSCVDNPLTELTFATLSNFKTGETPVPLAGIDPATLSTDPDGEPYEGVLVTIENVPVVNADFGFGQFSVGDAAAELVVGDDIFAYLDGNKLTNGQCLAAITGVMHRNIRDGHVIILPRDAADIDDAAGTCR
jgi:hypothetical protein